MPYAPLARRTLSRRRRYLPTASGGRLAISPAPGTRAPLNGGVCLEIAETAGGQGLH